MNIFHAWSNQGPNFFQGHDQATILTAHTLKVNKPDLLVFWGGADIYPGIYNQRPAHTPTMMLSRRDHIEMELFKAAILEDIPILGICRGSQFVCAMSGGELYQDIGSVHCHDHWINTKEGSLLKVTSTHHQMMSPQKVPHEVLGWCSPKAATYYKETQVVEPEIDYEIVYFPHTNALACQGHPEYMDAEEDFPKYIHKLVREKLLTN